MSHSGARQRGSLLVVGAGMTGAPQTTLEAIAAMRRADRLFYMVMVQATEEWIRELNPTAASLADLYGPFKNRRKTYAEMVQRIVAPVREGLDVCAVFYGHPGVFAQPSHRSIALLRRLGYEARMLPGVSADACLYADLGLNPGDFGIQSYEATDFLLTRRRFDPTSSLLLWQVGVLGESGADLRPCRPERLLTLTRRLRQYYPETHRVVIYYAPTFPADRAVVQRVALRKLPTAIVGPLATLYVPAMPQRQIDRRIAKWYDD